MIPYYGDFAEDDTVLIPFNTFSSDDPSASVTVTDLADADIKVHKDGGTTQIATDGATVAINFDSVTGNHLITVDTSAHADYSTGSEYAVRVEGVTVDGATINAWVGAFSIERAGGVLALIKAGNLSANVEQISGDSTAADNLEAAYDGTGFDVGGIDVSELNGIVDDLINGGRLDLLIDAIKAVTDNLPNSGSLTNLDAAISSRMPTTHIDATGGKVDGVALVDVTTENTDMRGTDSANTTTPLDASGIRSAVGMSSANLDTQLAAIAGYIDTEVAAIISAIGGLEDLSQAEAQAAAEAALTAFGAALEATLGSPAGASVSADIAAVKAVDDGIQTDLDNATDGLGALKTLIDTVNTDLSNGTDGLGALKTLLDGIKTVTDAIPDSGALTALTAAVAAILPAKNTALSNIEFIMVDATDGFTPETGITVSGTRSIDGGAYAAVTGSIAEVANGTYQFDASAADMNGTIITFRFTGTGCADRFLTIRTSG